MEDEEEKFIAITHFINPHQFWYTSTENDNISEVINLEEKITEHYMNSYSGTTRHFTPSKESLVAVQYVPNKKRFIRARIEERQVNCFTRNVSYLVWAIDHGFPFETSEEYIRYLPEEYSMPFERVRCGGIAKIVPAEHDFDFIAQVAKTEIKNKWTNQACDFLERALTDAASIAFSVQISKNDHFWGDLHIVNHGGILFRASDYLIHNKLALRNSERFTEMCLKSTQTQMKVWESNSGNSKYGKNKCPTVETMVDLNDKVCLPNKDEMKTANLKIAAWERHNEKATNYYPSTKDFDVKSVHSDIGDSSSKLGTMEEAFKNMNKGILLQQNEASHLKPSLVDFEYEEELQKNDEKKVEENSSIDQDNISSKASSINPKFRYLLEMRKKHPSKMISTNVGNVETKTDNEEKQSISEVPNQKSETSVRDDESVDKISVVSTATSYRSLDRTSYLNLLRTRNILPESSTKGDAASVVSSTNSKSGSQKVRLKKVENMIPAGFDLANLMEYRDKNHWHRKSTTRNEKQALNLSQSSESEISQQDFRFTRGNTDKRKVSDSDKTSEEIGKIDKKQDKHNKPVLEKSVKTTRMNSSGEGNSFSETGNISPLATIEEKLEPEKNSSTLRSNEKTKSKIQKNGLQCQKSFFSESLDNSDDSKYSSAQSNVEDDEEEANIMKISPDFIKPLKEKTIPIIENSSSNSKRNQLLTEVLPKSTENQPILKSDEKLMRYNFKEHLVLAHSQIPLCPADKLGNVFLAPTVTNEMRKMFIDKVYRVHSYAWPHMISGNGLFIVNASNSGKTWSYIPPLCSSITLAIQNCTNAPTYGPMAIVIVSSSENATEIGNACSRLLNKLDSTEAKIVLSYGLQNFLNTKIQLLESCAILVATPTNLLRLMEYNDHNEPLFDPNRIQLIILDDIDQIRSRAKEDFKDAFKRLYNLVPKIKGSKIMLPQLVVTSCMYEPMLAKLISISNHPLLLIGDFLEAAVYGKANITIKFCHKTEKMVWILKFLKKHPEIYEPLIILCNCQDDVLFVDEKLRDHGILTIAYQKQSPAWVRQEVNEWKAQPHPSKALVCSDDVFAELEIQNAQNLIHFSLAKTWSKFTLRFISLIKIYENLIVKGFDRPPLEKRATSLVLLDEDNNNEIPRLIEFLQNHNQINCIPPEVLKLSKSIQQQRETKRCGDSTQLCSALFEFGDCLNTRCEGRHVLHEADIKEDNMKLDQYGDIHFKVLNVFSPTHFSAHLLKYRATATSKWRIVRKSDEASSFSIRFNNFYYLDPNNLQMHWPVKVNDLCVYQRKNTFFRARVLEAKETKLNVIKSEQIKLKLIDIGEVVHAESDEVFICHDQFRDFPAQSVDIHLLGVRPCGNERVWNPDATNLVKNLIKDNLHDNEVLYASINFSLSGAIYVENVIIMEDLSTLKTLIYKDSVRKNLIKKNYGIKDETIVSRICSLIEEHGFGFILDKTNICNISNNSNEPDNGVVQTEEKDEVEPGSNQNQSLDSKQSHSDCDDGLQEKPEEKIINEQSSKEKSVTTLTATTQKTSPKSESELPAVCDFNEFVKCIQRSIAMDAEEYKVNNETDAQNLKMFKRYTDNFFKAAIAINEESKKRDEKHQLKEIDLLKKSQSHENEKHIQHSNELQKKEIEPLKNNKNHEEEKNNQQLQKKTEIPLIPRLFFLHERPPTVWYQTNYLIILSIHAPNIEVDDYYLKVTESYLHFSAYVNGKQQVLTLNFLGTVEPKFVTHEIRGLNVAIRLVKSLYIIWPRLVKHEEKMPWLTYNFNMINTKEMESFLPKQFMSNALNSNLRSTNDSDDNSIDSDNEYDVYGTFNPIVNREDFNDPLGSEMI